MQFQSILWIVAFVFLCEIEALWLVGKNGDDEICPRRSGAYSYYFGTTDLHCMRGKREMPWRGIWEITHRLLYYRGYYFDFLDNSRAYILRSRRAGHRCDGGLEGSPAGYSQVSISCLKGCARNYRCQFGDYNLLSNNCHHFANRLSFVLCRVRKGYCPTWCLRSCNDATDYTT
ncbi:uncharacterized protein LOC144619131 [Crassostrea virginica]